MNLPLSMPARALRVASLAIACTAVFILAALFHHPVVSGPGNARETLAQIAQLRFSDNMVHGALTAMLVVLASALTAFGDALGARRPAVRGAFVAYCLGCVLLGVAMLFDGFILPRLAIQFVSAKPFDTEVVTLIVRAISITIQMFSKAGLIAQCVAMLLWSYAAATSREPLPGGRWCAVLGVPAGLVPAAFILFADMHLTPHSLMAIFAAHAAWYLAVAALLYRCSLAGACAASWVHPAQTCTE